MKVGYNTRKTLKGASQGGLVQVRGNGQRRVFIKDEEQPGPESVMDGDVRRGVQTFEHDIPIDLM